MSQSVAIRAHVLVAPDFAGRPCYLDRILSVWKSTNVHIVAPGVMVDGGQARQTCPIQNQARSPSSC